MAWAEASTSWVHDIVSVMRTANPLEAVSAWIHDVSVFCLNDCESECGLSESLSCRIVTHETHEELDTGPTYPCTA